MYKIAREQAKEQAHEVVQYIRELTNDSHEGYSGIDDGTTVTVFINNIFSDYITYSTEHIGYYHNYTYTDLTKDFKKHLRKLKLQKINENSRP